MPTTTITSWSERDERGHAELDVVEPERDPEQDAERPDEDQRERLADQVRADHRADGRQLTLLVDRAERGLERGGDLAAACRSSGCPGADAGPARARRRARPRRAGRSGARPRRDGLAEALAAGLRRSAAAATARLRPRRDGARRSPADGAGDAAATRRSLEADARGGGAGVGAGRFGVGGGRPATEADRRRLDVEEAVAAACDRRVAEALRREDGLDLPSAVTFCVREPDLPARAAGVVDRELEALLRRS